jgi:hypothetical protein
MTARNYWRQASRSRDSRQNNLLWRWSKRYPSVGAGLGALEGSQLSTNDDRLKTDTVGRAADPTAGGSNPVTRTALNSCRDSPGIPRCLLYRDTIVLTFVR